MLKWEGPVRLALNHKCYGKIDSVMKLSRRLPKGTISNKTETISLEPISMKTNWYAEAEDVVKK
jgi:hypothetical protein